VPGHGPLAVSAGLDHVDQSAGDVGGVVLVVHWIVSVGSHVRTQRCAAFAGSDSAGSARGVQPWPSTQRVGKRGLGPAALVANGLDAESGPSRHGSEPDLDVLQSDLVAWLFGETETRRLSAKAKASWCLDAGEWRQTRSMTRRRMKALDFRRAHSVHRGGSIRCTNRGQFSRWLVSDRDCRLIRHFCASK